MSGDRTDYGFGSTGVSGGFAPIEDRPRRRQAICAWCDRSLRVKFSMDASHYVYPPHGDCAGNGAIVPPGAFLGRQ